MTQAANNYGQVLYELKVPKEIVEEAEVLFREVPQLKAKKTASLTGYFQQS